MICVFILNSFANSDKNKNNLSIEKKIIKSLRIAAARKDKKSLDKIALKMEKYYCSSPGHEKGFIAIRKASLLIEQGKYQQAIDFINILLEKDKAGFNKVALTVVILLKGQALLELDKFNSALKVFRDVENSYKADIKNIPEIYRINILYCLATCEDALRNFSAALHYYKEFLGAYEKFYQQAPSNKSYLYRSMGRCCRKLKDYNEAHKYLQLAMNCATDKYSRAMISGSLGVTYQKQKKFSQAIECYDKSLEYFFSDKTAFAKYIAQISLAKAKVLILDGQKNEAIRCLKDALYVPYSDDSAKKINQLISKIRKN